MLYVFLAWATRLCRGYLNEILKFRSSIKHWLKMLLRNRWLKNGDIVRHVVLPKVIWTRRRKLNLVIALTLGRYLKIVNILFRARFKCSYVQKHPGSIPSRRILKLVIALTLGRYLKIVNILLRARFKCSYVQKHPGSIPRPALEIANK